MSRAATAVIDLGALHHNLQRVRDAAPGKRVLAVVKADGYGHGLLRVARALADADAYAVACIEEAMALREEGVGKPVVLLEGCFDAEELALASRHAFEVVVHHESQLEILERARLVRPVRAWLKIDTGMHRLGFAPQAALAAWQRLTACESVSPRIGLFTHLANADVRGDGCTPRQLAVFRAALPQDAGEVSIANSAAVLGWPEAHADWVRPGIMLYGASPFVERRGADDGLRPVMTLSTRLIAVNRCRRGDALGYGGTWTCPEDMPVGVAAIGYGDGYPRHAASGTPVLVNGRRVPLVGRVCMDMILLDLRAAPHARVGDPVVCWGEGLPVEEIAQHASTIAYTLLCGITRRVRFSESDG
jgi:alanine racemase